MADFDFENEDLHHEPADFYPSLGSTGDPAADLPLPFDSLRDSVGGSLGLFLASNPLSQGISLFGAHTSSEAPLDSGRSLLGSENAPPVLDLAHAQQASPASQLDVDAAEAFAEAAEAVAEAAEAVAEATEAFAEAAEDIPVLEVAGGADNQLEEPLADDDDCDVELAEYDADEPLIEGGHGFSNETHCVRSWLPPVHLYNLTVV
jgi:hypothetical protein